MRALPIICKRTRTINLPLVQCQRLPCQITSGVVCHAWLAAIGSYYIGNAGVGRHKVTQLLRVVDPEQSGYIHRAEWQAFFMIDSLELRKRVQVLPRDLTFSPVWSYHQYRASQNNALPASLSVFHHCLSMYGRYGRTAWFQRPPARPQGKLAC